MAEASRSGPARAVGVQSDALVRYRHAKARGEVEDSQPPAAPPERPRAFTAPTETAVAEATPADAAPAAEPTPPASMPRVTSKQPRQRVHHERGRNDYSYTGSPGSFGTARNMGERPGGCWANGTPSVHPRAFLLGGIHGRAGSHWPGPDNIAAVHRRLGAACRRRWRSK